MKVMDVESDAKYSARRWLDLCSSGGQYIILG